jgi:anaerobic selenocysteine-containing dehydrogenase
LTDNGKVNLAPAEFLALAKGRLPKSYEKHLDERNTMRLITKRERYSHNTWTHNDEAFIKGRRYTNYLYVHPDDASRHGIAEGDSVEVESGAGRVRVPATLDDDMMPGTVALPHGWGHQSADGMRVAQTTGGANANVLAADGPDNIEPISGMAQFNGIPVTLRKTTD